MKGTAALLALLLAAGAASCATAPGPEANRTRFTRNVGQATPTYARELTLRILNQYGFVVEQEHPIPEIVIQSRWKDRAPFADEEIHDFVDRVRRFIGLRPDQPTRARRRRPDW